MARSIPVTLLRHRTTPLDGTAPVLLYGYGSYGITIPADFRTGRLSLVDRGFIYAVADVRGSMAKGYQWYLDGKLEKKVNTFTDFVAAGRHLVEPGLHVARPHRRDGRISGRHADGRRRQPRPDAVRRHHRRRALRRCAQHDVGRDACRSRRRNGRSGATR